MRRVAWVPLMLLFAACGTGDAGPSAPSVTDQRPAPTPAPSATPVPMATPEPTPPPTPEPPAMTVVLRSARLRGANGHSASGTARIERTGNRHQLVLSNDFRLDAGNTDLYLTNDPSGVGNRDLNLGALRSLTGGQSYDMPHDGGQYGYVVLWCRPFRVVIGVGELR